MSDGFRFAQLTTVTAHGLEAGDRVRVVEGNSRVMRRVQRSMSGETFLYPEWPGRNRHERRQAAARARKI